MTADTSLAAMDASERRLRQLIEVAIPDPHARLTVLLAVTEYGLACEKAGIRGMREAYVHVRADGEAK